MDWKSQAIKKIANELKDFRGGVKEVAVSKFVAEKLTMFCQENERFAEVVFRTTRTLSDCCAEVMAGCGNAISDIEVYKKAVQHYFPNADIHMTMEIAFTGDEPTEEEMERAPKIEPQKAKAKKKTKDDLGQEEPEDDKSGEEGNEPNANETTPMQPPVSKPKPKQKKVKSEVESLQLTLF